MSKAILVKSDMQLSVIDFDESNSYEIIKEAVGGWIDCVRLPDYHCDMWINDEGKLEGLPANPIGSVLYSTLGGDWIAGDIIITGGIDDEGNTIGLSDELCNLLENMVEVIIDHLISAIQAENEEETV